MGYFFSLSKSATNSALNWSEVFLLICGVVLVIGIIGEEVEKWELHKRLFVALVVAGVAGELIADGGIFLFSHQLQVMSDNEIAEANRNAGNAADAAGRAERSAQGARDKSAAVEKQADALDIRLGAASDKLGKLEQQLLIQGPRWQILEDNRDAFIKALKPFAKQRFTVVSCGWNPPVEPYKVEQGLLNLLGERGAGWSIGSPGYVHWSLCANGATTVGGNEVTFSSAANQTVKDAAQALSDELNKLSISTILMPTLGGPKDNLAGFMGPDSPWVWAAKDPTSAVVLVGPNPMFDVAGWKKRHK
jgi:hypothetical protein